MSRHLDRISDKIETLRKAITQHEVYASIQTIDDLKIFMRHHVYAVWDFMSLLKSLQKHLTCTNVHWLVTGSAETRYLINEIVVGEESDVDLDGKRKSHFEMYLDAMDQCEADTAEVMRFISELTKGKSVREALDLVKVPGGVKDFVRFTFDSIDSNKLHIQSAIFTFGREDLIPDMFLSLVKDLDSKFPGRVSLFKYYLERHIEVDGDHHSHLAMKMTSNLCGESETNWSEAEKAVCEALERRIALWDGAVREINSKRLVTFA